MARKLNPEVEGGGEEEHEDEEGSQNELYFMMLLQMCLGLITQILVYIFLTRRVVWA